MRGDTDTMATTPDAMSGIVGTLSVEDRVKELEEKIEGKVRNETWDAKVKDDDSNIFKIETSVTRVEERIKNIDEGTGELQNVVNDWVVESSKKLALINETQRKCTRGSLRAVN